jgi:hypothetical protein
MRRLLALSPRCRAGFVAPRFPAPRNARNLSYSSDKSNLSRPSSATVDPALSQMSQEAAAEAVRLEKDRQEAPKEGEKWDKLDVRAFPNIPPRYHQVTKINAHTHTPTHKHTQIRMHSFKFTHNSTML